MKPSVFEDLKMTCDDDDDDPYRESQTNILWSPEPTEDWDKIRRADVEQYKHHVRDGDGPLRDQVDNDDDQEGGDDQDNKRPPPTASHPNPYHDLQVNVE